MVRQKRLCGTCKAPEIFYRERTERSGEQYADSLTRSVDFLGKGCS